ncbi:MAG: hypothetical protein ACOY94_02780 [Bacillota bacterium]
MSDHRLRISQAETLCIRTTKVYDWCYKNGTTSFVITDLVFPTDTSSVAGVECEITNIACAEINRDQSGGGVAVVTLRKQATFDLTFVDASGDPVSVIIGGETVLTQSRTRFFDEFVQLCAPDGTVVACEVTDSGCRAELTTVNGTQAIAVAIFICQSIQVEADVNVCIDVNDFCAPDVCSQVEKPFACPPTQLFPPQCDPDDPRYTPPCETSTTIM